MARRGKIVDESTDIYGDCIVRSRHKVANALDMSKILDIPISHEWKAGDFISRGEKLPPLLRGENYSACTYTMRDRAFGDILKIIVEKLSAHKEIVVDFVLSGGRVEIYFQLNGRENVGDSLGPDLLIAIGMLRIELQIEVFPNF
ncbi:hypothetical protein D3C80_1676430 [compost metagenome]